MEANKSEYGKIEVKTDCQMYRKQVMQCTGLKALYYKYGICKFYKKEEDEEK